MTKSVAAASWKNGSVKILFHLLTCPRLQSILHINDNISNVGDCLNIIISNMAGIPIYGQIKEQVKAAIFSGEVKEGDVLPSTRQLARDLKISVITTTRAYADLEQEGFVVNVPGKGCYVQPQNTDLIREQKLREIEESLSAAVTSAKMMSLPDDDLKQMLAVMLKEDTNG